LQKYFINLTAFIIIFFCFGAAAANANDALLLNIQGAIGPAAESFIEHALKVATDEHASVLILQLDTPGGLDTAMRTINKDILASSVPVVTYVAPTGARAASAGTFILYASHLAAMAPGTNLGAASPVPIGGSHATTHDIDEKNKLHAENLSTSEKKSTNDAAAYIRSLGELRGHNVTFAEDAVRNANSLSATEALQQKVIDVIATSPTDLLQQINGRTVTVDGKPVVLDTAHSDIKTIEPDWRYAFLAAITDPNIAYILLLLGIYGLFFEFYNPGFVFPGVVGGIALLIALYAFQLLPVNYVGFALLLLGITFMIIEVLISSFGILGIGGIIAFVTGSILLLDVNSPGYRIAWSLIATMTVLTTLFFVILITLAIRAMRKTVITGREALIGSVGEVLQILNSHELLIKIQGEIWKASANQRVRKGQKVRVLNLSGLSLTVEPIAEIEPSVRS
jgi:membrane-bound serine protease (ClpP class)